MTGRLAAELVEGLRARQQDGAADALGQSRQGALRHERRGHEEAVGAAGEWPIGAAVVTERPEPLDLHPFRACPLDALQLGGQGVDRGAAVAGDRLDGIGHRGERSGELAKFGVMDRVRQLALEPQDGVPGAIEGQVPAHAQQPVGHGVSVSGCR